MKSIQNLIPDLAVISTMCDVSKPATSGLIFMKNTVEVINQRRHTNSRLTAISLFKVKYKSGDIYFAVCKCNCGNECKVRVSYIISGSTLSCGCKAHENLIKRNTKWSNNNRHIGGIYRGMVSRCYDKLHPSYKTYGGNGVKVCDEWLNDYQSFVDWCNANGWQRGYDLDKDTKGDGYLYSPDTCCFVEMHINRSYQPKWKTKKRK